MLNYTSQTGVRPAIFWLLLGVCITIPVLGEDVLYFIGIEHNTINGSALEKLHPSTYMVMLAFGLWCLDTTRRKLPLIKVLTGQPAAFALLMSLMLFLVYNALAIGEQFSIIVESFIVPVLLLYLLRDISDEQKRPLTLCLHVVFILNSTIGIYEFVTSSNLFPPELVDYTGSQIDMSEWEVTRVSALWGHPLTATLATCAYLLANLVMPANSPFPRLRGIGVLVSLVALPGFGGRFSMLLFVLFTAYLGIRWAVTLLMGKRAPGIGDWIAVAAILVAIAAVLIGNEAGYFDRFIDRLYDDDGSASTRSVALDLLLNTDTMDILFGDVSGNLASRLAAAGTPYGIEVFWIAFLLRYGLLLSLVVFPCLLGFIAQAARDLGFAGGLIASYFIMSQSGAIGLCAKTTIFSCVILICYLLLPRRQELSRSRLAMGAPRLVRGGNLLGASPSKITNIDLHNRDLR